MNDELARRAQRILEDALEHDEGERDAYVAEACAGDEALESEVRSLLEALDEAGDFLESPAEFQPDGSPGSCPEDLVGARLGQYAIESVIASGGMGTVYLAQQENPRRTVAIKVLRAGLNSTSALRRFEYESHILARLHHPDIAQVHDAGTHVVGDEGEAWPYFVMEYVEQARPLTTYADERGLDLKTRLTLFARICDAVHHGHQNGIIHRDLKPANVLVNESGHPKVIDFGIARIETDELPGGTLVTGEGQVLGTLQYMSPEQCSGKTDAVDTRTDVYALGVVLYELVCGRLPYNVGTTVFEAARIVREQVPERPGTINAQLGGDLETIILTALAKEPDRRYASASSLASDLRRYLACTPIAARPPSTLHEIRLFARRNRPVVVAGALAVVALIAGA
ncbi:MAG: serine/threonine-protein kinase, partial [Planctomycetota bacterium]